MKEGWKKVHSRWIQEGDFSDDNFVKIQPGIKAFQSSISCFSRVLAGQWTVVLSSARNAKPGGQLQWPSARQQVSNLEGPQDIHPSAKTFPDHKLSKLRVYDDKARFTHRKRTGETGAIRGSPVTVNWCAIAAATISCCCLNRHRDLSRARQGNMHWDSFECPSSSSSSARSLPWLPSHCFG